MRSIRHLFSISLLLALSGCAYFEYDLREPANLAKHIGDEKEEIFSLPPLEYRMQSAESRLVIRIFNTTDDSILLMGRQSAVVDQNGQSHPLPDQTIAPHSFVKLILPPLRPQLEPTGPSVGVGFGVATNHRRPYGAGAFYDPNEAAIADRPEYYDVYNPNDAMFWDWSGETDVRLFLVFRRDKAEIHHEFLFHRKET